MALRDNPQFATADAHLHTLWTKAVGTADYDKSQWRELEACLISTFSELEQDRMHIRFYASVISHRHNGLQECEIARAVGKGCCNVSCLGQWGTNCWCCHALKYATLATVDEMRQHLLMATEARLKK